MSNVTDSTVVMIAPTISQPRFHKRAIQLKSFCNVEVFAFSRGYYEVNTFPPELPFTSLGKVEDGNYGLRIFNLARAINMIRRRTKTLGNCHFYAMGLDCLIAARLSGIKRGFYEIGDLRQAEGFGRFFAVPERWLLRSISGFVLTSRYFYEDFYRYHQAISQDKIYIINNKVNPFLRGHRPQAKHFSNERIIIGLVGLLRYQRPIELLLEFAQANPDKYVVECFGDGPLKRLIEFHEGENIRYHGAFKNPEELPEIYKKIHLNYVVYDNRSKNVRLAIPNKLFESAFFGVPLISCENTAIGKMADEWGIGRTVRINNAQDFAEDMGSVDFSWLKANSQNCFKIPTEELMDDGMAVLERMLTNTLGISPKPLYSR